MKRRLVLILGLTLFVSVPHALRAQTARDSVLAVVNQLFHTMTAHDSAGTARIMDPALHFYSVSSPGDSVVVQTMAYAQLLPFIGGMKQRMVEQMSNPVVQVHGAMAMVWAPYDVHEDGKFAYCGVDAFTLARERGGWKLVSAAFTVEMKGCKGEA